MTVGPEVIGWFYKPNLLYHGDGNYGLYNILAVLFDCIIYLIELVFFFCLKKFNDAGLLLIS